MFPGTERAPPMTTSSFARHNVAGSLAAQRAILVRGPTAMIEIVFGGCLANRLSITSQASSFDGVNKCGLGSPVLVVCRAVAEMTDSSGGKSKRSSHGSFGKK